MGTTCDLVEDLFRIDHLGWSKLECIVFLRDHWMSQVSGAIGWDTTLPARFARGREK